MLVGKVLAHRGHHVDRREEARRVREERRRAAEGLLQEALLLARQQEAKILELRAAVSLSRVWQTQGQGVRAREVLGTVYAWFTEGFETVDLQEARALLADLA